MNFKVFCISLKMPACSMISLSSFLAEKGHQPLVRFCLNRLMVGTEPSVLSMSSEQRPALRAPRGNLVRSSVIAPRKSSLENESASHTLEYFEVKEEHLMELLRRKYYSVYTQWLNYVLLGGNRASKFLSNSN